MVSYHCYVALCNPKTSISTQQHHPYTRSLISEMPGDSKTAFDIGEMFQVLCQHYLLIRCVWYGAGSLQHDSNLLCSLCLLTRHVCYGAGSLQYNSNLLLSVCLLMRYVCYGAGSLQHNSNLLRGASGRPGVRLWQVEVVRRQHHVSKSIHGPSGVEHPPYGCWGHPLCCCC